MSICSYDRERCFSGLLKNGRQNADCLLVPLRALLLFILAVSARAIEIGPLETGLAAAEGDCRLSRPSASVDARDPQFLVRFMVRTTGRPEQLRVEWVDPAGAVAESTRYENLPANRLVCVINALQVGGFAPATWPGRWRVRVTAGGAVLREREFEILGRASMLSVRVVEASPSQIVLDTRGAQPDATINLARYRESGQWEYVAVLLASRREGNRIWAATADLPPGEYLAILRNPDGAQSLPARFVIGSGSTYRKPFPDGEQWRVSQRPYGTFSHYGRAVHAWDFAPVHGRFVTAMRGGIVQARDLGLGQTPGQRSFGNFITIRHDDGTFAHYAHLKSGSLRVHSGQRVEARQILAEAGTSGYSLGRHVHVHLTRSPPIVAPSVPFDFVPALPGSPPATFSTSSGWKGTAAFAQWWSRPLRVPRRARQLAVCLAWHPPEVELALYLILPSVEWISAPSPELSVSRPQPGTWRVSVQSPKGDASFHVKPEITLASP